jgi:hypothetical protein
MVHAGAGSPKKPAARPRVLRKRSFGVWMLSCSALEVFSQHFPIAEVLEGFRPADTAQAWNTSVARVWKLLMDLLGIQSCTFSDCLHVFLESSAHVATMYTHVAIICPRKIISVLLTEES